MTNSTNTPQYLPLPPRSQGSNSNVLFYDSKAPNSDILDCALNRLNNSQELGNILRDIKQPTATQVKIVLTITELLTSDAIGMINNIQANVNNL